MPTRLIIVSTALVLLSMAAAPTRAAPAYDACTGTISSLPAVISTQGTWCMKSDLSTSITSGSAVDVLANNVTIDCNGFRLGGLAAGPATLATGIHVDSRVNTTVRNCKIRGFSDGIHITGDPPSAGHVVEDNLLEGNTHVGVTVAGDQSVVRRNRIFDTGGSSLIPGQIYAMYLIGGVDAIDNNIVGVTASDPDGYALAVGIHAMLNVGSRLAGNQIRELARGASGTAVGINLIGVTRADVVGNYLVGPSDFGISCSDVTGVARGNHLTGVGTPISLCTSSGNLVVP